MNRRTIWVVVTLLVAVAGGYALYRRSSRQEGPRFDTVRVERGRISARITATGTLSALVTVQVGAQVSGRIQSLHADFNSPVKKGELIARIDPQLFEASLEQARANYVAAQAAVAKAEAAAADARRQQARSRALFEKNLIAVADRDTADANADEAVAQVQAAKANVEQTRAALHQAEVNLAYTSIFSPINGVVISRNVDVGQTVASALQAPTLFTIAEDLRKMQVHTNVAEADVGRLAEGMTATFRVDAYPSDNFKGTISQIRNSPQTVQNVVTYDAVIDVDNSDLRLRPGMTANATVVYAEKDDSLKVPNAALRFRPPPELMRAAGGGEGKKGEKGRGPGPGRADHKTLWVLRNGQPAPVGIRVGISDGTTTEVLEGELQEGDQAITDMSGGAGGAGGPSKGGAPGGGPPPGGFRRMF